MDITQALQIYLIKEWVETSQLVRELPLVVYPGLTESNKWW